MSKTHDIDIPNNCLSTSQNDIYLYWRFKGASMQYVKRTCKVPNQVNKTESKEERQELLWIMENNRAKTPVS